jgi:hypothetical protein
MKLGGVLLLLAFIAATPEMRYFRYERPIQNLPQQSGQACFTVDASIFAHAAPQLADLRVNSNGAETPYAIHMDVPSEAAEKSIALLNLGLHGGQTVFDAAMPDGSYSDLQMTVAAQNFIATVAISGSQAQGANRETKLGSYTIFDLTRQRLGRSTILHLPTSDFRYLHFRIAGPLTPQSVTGLSITRQPASQPKYQVVAETAQFTLKGHASIMEFTVPAHVPVDRIAFTPSAEPALFSRDVHVSVTTIKPGTPPDTVETEYPVQAFGNLLRVHSVQNGHRIDEERLALDAPWVDNSLPTKWIVTLENRDDVPLKLERVRLEMRERKLCFQAAANASYTLFYGDAALSAPVYDYATLFAVQADASAATAGPEQANAAYEPRPDERPFTERHPALLWAALVAVIALLGGIALRSVKRTTVNRGG